MSLQNADLKSKRNRVVDNLRGLDTRARINVLIQSLLSSNGNEVGDVVLELLGILTEMTSGLSCVQQHRIAEMYLAKADAIEHRTSVARKQIVQSANKSFRRFI
jgi:hypothetical protein